MGDARILKAKAVLLPGGIVEDGAVAIRGGLVAAAGRASEVERQVALEAWPETAWVEDFGDAILAPGFVDIHVHGCRGRLVDESAEAALELSRHLAAGGTTSFLPTALTARGAANCAAAARYQRAAAPDGAQIAGIHMEGPFLSPKRLEGAPGADAALAPPSVEELERILGLGEGLVRMMGLAVELPGAEAVVRRLAGLGIVAAVAHSQASYEEVERAAGWGLSHATHLYNVMTGLQHRAPGVVGAVLTDDRLSAELICDGRHLHPAAIDIALRCKGPGRLAIITDLTLGGLPDGTYSNGAVSVVVRDGVATFAGVDPSSPGAIAGGTAPIAAGVAAVAALGYPLEAVLRMASTSPARIAGLGSKGSLEPGKDADLVVLGRDLSVRATIAQGATVYRAGR